MVLSGKIHKIPPSREGDSLLEFIGFIRAENTEAKYEFKRKLRLQRII